MLGSSTGGDDGQRVAGGVGGRCGDSRTNASPKHLWSLGGLSTFREGFVDGWRIGLWPKNCVAAGITTKPAGGLVNAERKPSSYSKPSVGVLLVLALSFLVDNPQDSEKAPGLQAWA